MQERQQQCGDSSGIAAVCPPSTTQCWELPPDASIESEEAATAAAKAVEELAIADALLSPLALLSREAAGSVLASQEQALAAVSSASADCKLVYCFRHGQSAANAARTAAVDQDKADGCSEEDLCSGQSPHQAGHNADQSYHDAPLSPEGVSQCQKAASGVLEWSHVPSLVVVSPMTRALQTAGLIFEQQLCQGTARLVILPDLREYFSNLVECKGRTTTELLQCEALRALPAWTAIEKALSGPQAALWSAEWDQKQACGDDWQAHVDSGDRMERLREWILSQHEKQIVTVSHYGTIDNFLNREVAREFPDAPAIPWQQFYLEYPHSFQSRGRVLDMQMENAGFRAIVVRPTSCHVTSPAPAEVPSPHSFTGEEKASWERDSQYNTMQGNIYPDSHALIEMGRNFAGMIPQIFSTYGGIKQCAAPTDQMMKAVAESPEGIAELAKCDVSSVYIDTQPNGGDMPQMELLVIKPKNLSTKDALIFYHGGGFIGSSPQSELHRLCRFADLFNATIFAPEYGIPIDHPVPACASNAYSAVKYVAENADELGVDSTRIATMGESHGGHTVAAVSIQLARRGEGSLLKFAWADIPAVSNRWMRMEEADCNWEELPCCVAQRQVMKLYAGGKLEDAETEMDAYIDNPDVFPVCMDDELTRRVPMTFVSSREFCFFKQDALEYAALLKRNGKLLDEVYVQSGTAHASAYMPGMAGTKPLLADEQKIWRRLIDL